MPGKVKTWVWVVVAIVVVGILGIVAMAGVGFWFVSQHMETREASPVIASHDFDQVKSRFTGQKPLVEIDQRGNLLRSNLERPAQPGAPTPHDVHVMVFDADKGRVVRFSIPFWLLRLKTGGATIDLNGRRMDLEDLRLSVEDLERFGPTLIVDHTSPAGDRVLVWSQ
jgi:hypothetical protein